MDSWQTAYLHEIQGAAAARASGNEGRARVCARRAASILIAEYLTRQGIPLPSSSAHDRLRYLASLPGLTPTVYKITAHLLTRVDKSFSLPADIDLLAEVQQLSSELFL